METFRAIKHDIKTVSNEIKRILNKDYLDLFKYYWFSKIKKEKDEISLDRLYDNEFIGLSPYNLDCILKYRKIIPNFILEDIKHDEKTHSFIIKEKIDDKHYFIINFNELNECYECYHVNKEKSIVKNKNSLGYKFYFQLYDKHSDTWATYEPSDKLYKSRKALYEDIQKLKNVNPNNWRISNSSFYGVNKVKIDINGNVTILKKLKCPYDFNMSDRLVYGGSQDNLHQKNHTYLK